MRLFCITLAGVALLSAGIARAEDRKVGDTFEAIVRDVRLADVLKVEIGGREETIRLYAAMTPGPLDGDHTWMDARQFTSEAVPFGTRIQVTVKNLDGVYPFCEVLLPDGTSLGELLVRNGWAHLRKDHAKEDKAVAELFTALEKFASAKRLGFWRYHKD